MPFSALNMLSDEASSLRNTPSVISSSSRAAEMPAEAIALVTMAGSAGFANWIGDTLTATRTFSGHIAASAQAVRSTHSPIASISPHSSATGMKSAGLTAPRVGWFHRNSAS